MKKRMLRLLAMCLSLCLLAAPALAVDATILRDETVMPEYMSFGDAVVVGDTAYFKVYTHDEEQIWYWREGMEQAEKAAGGLVRGSNYLSVELAASDVGEEKAKYAIVALFSDGERLLGLNHLNGLIFAMDVQDGQITFTDVVTLQDTSMFYRDSGEFRFYWSPNSTAVSGGYLYWCSSGWSEKAGDNVGRITRFSLTDGSVYDLPMSVDQASYSRSPITAYRSGTILILHRDGKSGDPYRLSIYDPLTDDVRDAGVIDDVDSISRIAYAPELDVLLYQDGTRIMGRKALGEAKLYTYVPTTASGRLVALGDTLVMVTTTSIVARTLTEGFTAPESLQLMNGGMTGGDRSFLEKYPLIPLEYVDDRADTAAKYVEAFLTVEGENAVDVARISTTTDYDAFVRLRDEGMLLDLSADPELAAFVEALYPPFRELISTEERVWGIPTSTSSYTGFFINKSAMKDLGLTLEEMPTNLVELCEFVTRWNREFAAKYPQYACIEYTENTRWYLLDMMTEMWISYCQATGQELHFDDPVFRELLTALEKVETAAADASMQTTDPEVSNYKEGLFWMRCQLVGNWASYMEDYSDRIFIPMTLTADTPFGAEVSNVELWVVNRATESPEYAMKLLKEKIAAIDEKYSHVLLTTETEPVESPYYAEPLADAEKKLHDLKEKLADERISDSVRETLTAALEEHEYYMSHELARTKYNVTPSAIEHYVNVLAPAMYIHLPNVLEDTEEGIDMLNGLNKRWLQGEIDTEQYIREADMRLMMLQLAQ